MAVKPHIELTPQQQAIILRLIQKHLSQATIWAYGSRVKGTAKPSSDLDLVVLHTRPDAPALYALREAFDDSDLPFRVDLFAWDSLPETFKPSINKDRVVLYEGKNQGV